MSGRSLEVGADTRKHDLQFDRNGYQRDSQAITPKVGSTFELTRKLIRRGLGGLSVAALSGSRPAAICAV